jgi:aminoglycoside phosphotransferase (APT) family kinase protein
VLAYKPERRFVAQVLSGGQPHATLKFYTPADFSRASRNAKVLKVSGFDATPERLARSRRLRIIALAWVQGDVLANLLARGSSCAPSLRRAGAVLARLHGADPGKLTSRSTWQDIDALAVASRAVQWLVPELSGRARLVESAIAQGLRARTPAAAAIHGDFHARQVIVRPDAGVALIDLDEAARGDPAWDLGNFLAHALRELHGRGELGIPASELRDHLLAGYAEIATPPPSDAIDLYLAAGLLRIAPHAFRERRSDWPGQALRILQDAEAALPQALDQLYPRTLPGVHDTVSISDPMRARGDPAMPLLRAALDPLEMRRHFNRQALDLLAIRATRHKPGRRCIVEFDVQPVRGSAGPFTIVGKVRAKGLDTRTLHLARFLWEHGFGDDAPDGISIPEPLGAIPALNMWLQRKVPGVPASALLSGPQGRSAAERLADIALKLHRSKVPTDRVHGIQDELKILEQRLGRLELERPAWARRLRALFDSARRAASALLAPSPCGIHRDFYPDQVLFAGPRAWLLDLDLYCLGDAALDIGNCLAHITDQSLRLHGDATALHDQERALVDRFVDAAGQPARPAVEIYAMLSLARLVQISTLIPARQAFTEALLTYCERSLR